MVLHNIYIYIYEQRALLYRLNRTKEFIKLISSWTWCGMLNHFSIVAGVKILKNFTPGGGRGGGGDFRCSGEK